MRGGAALSAERVMALYEGTAPDAIAVPRGLEQAGAGVTEDTYVTNERGYFGPVSGLAVWQEQQMASLGQTGGGSRHRLRKRRVTRHRRRKASRTRKAAAASRQRHRSAVAASRKASSRV
jgi:hypothetical protein